MKIEINELIIEKQLNLNDYDDTSELSEILNYSGAIDEIIDSNIDIYYIDIRKWAVDNWEYVEEAISEGLTEGVEDYHKLIQAGQYVYYRNEANNAIEEIFQEHTEKMEEIEEKVESYVNPKGDLKEDKVRFVLEEYGKSFNDFQEAVGVDSSRYPTDDVISFIKGEL